MGRAAAVVGRVVAMCALAGGCSSSGESGAPDAGAASDANEERPIVAGDDGSSDGPSTPLVDGSSERPRDVAAVDATKDASLGADAAADAGADDAAEACAVRRCGVDVACGVADFGCGAPLVCPPCAQTLKIVALDDAKHLALNRANGQLFVSVGAAGGAHANQVVVIDPVLGTVIGTLAIPEGPDQLAVSEDGSRLWISVASGAALRWVDLTSAPPLVSAPVTLPAAADGTATRVGGMGAVPGASHSLAVSVIYPGFAATLGAGTFVFDDGAVRAAHSPPVDFTSPSKLIGGPSGVLFQVFSGRSPQPPTVTIHVTSTAVTEVQHDDSFTTADAVYMDGLLYTAMDIVFDVHDPDHPIALGSIEGDSANGGVNGRLVVPRPGNVYVMGDDFPNNQNLALRLIDVAAHRAVTSSTLSGTGQGSIWDLVAVPPARMAMIHQASIADPPTRIFIIAHDLLGMP